MVMDQNFSCYYEQSSKNPNMFNNLRGTTDHRILTGNDRPISNKFNFDVQGQSVEGDSPEDFDFSDEVLRYINHILMEEEDVEDKTYLFQESAALQEAEKSFYEALGGQNLASRDYQLVSNLDQSIESPDEVLFGESRNYCAPGDVEPLCPDWYDDHNCRRLDGHSVFASVVSESTSQSSHSSLSSNSTTIDGPIDSPVSTLTIPGVLSDNESALKFQEGADEARKFLPIVSNLIVDANYTNLGVKLGDKFDKDSVDKSRLKKDMYRERMGLEEERISKQSAVYSESSLTRDMYDKVLLCSGGKNEIALRKELSEVTISTSIDTPPKGSNGGKTRGKKQGSKRNVVDLRTLLTLCAQAVSADDRRAANEFLKQIREHATPTGDGMQRLAYYFADGLEARMVTGNQIYAPTIKFPTSFAELLRAYHIYVATCPFVKVSYFLANKTIMNVSEKVTSLHIIDYGILYGFQWPCFIQRLSARPGGPPKLRITGIDFPCPGFRPAERVEETGRRLASYAETFKVPFEFNAIAQKWETIKLEDLKIDKDELLVVNSLYRFRSLLDETVIVNSPRNIVLHLIKEMNPAVFVQGIVNGAHNAPFFITRFREALFHYSSLFDMFDAIIPREIHERMLFEKISLGREAMNVIACEAAERTERPETYRQWQIRNMRAGFEQLPLDREIVKYARKRSLSSYHKDFVIDEDGHWLLQGWKGRIIYALSTWRPAY